MDKNTSNIGLGFMDVLQIVFIILKLCGVIQWSWFWVLAPLWISVIIVVLIIVIIMCLNS